MKNDPAVAFPHRNHVGFGGMVYKPGLIAAKKTVNAPAVAEFHQAGKPNRVIKPAAAFGLALGENLALIFDQWPSPLNILAGK